MNKPWRTSNSPRGLGICLSLVTSIGFSMSLVGCYSGWSRNKNTGGGSGGSQQEPGDTTPGALPFSFILLEVIRPSSVPGHSACGNGDSPTLVEFRQNEWNERTLALAKALAPLTDHFRKDVIEIDGADCQTLQAVETRAETQSPLTSPFLPQISDPAGRPIINLKVVLWAGQQPSLGIDQLPQTFQQNWADWVQLAQSGFSNLQSLHQFVLANSSGGALVNWHNALPIDTRLDGTAIENVDPTDQATANRQAVIAQDTENLVYWLRQTAAVSPQSQHPTPGGWPGGIR